MVEGECGQGRIEMLEEGICRLGPREQPCFQSLTLIFCTVGVDPGGKG